MTTMMKTQTKNKKVNQKVMREKMMKKKIKRLMTVMILNQVRLRAILMLRGKVAIKIEILLISRFKIKNGKKSTKSP